MNRLLWLLAGAALLAGIVAYFAYVGSTQPLIDGSRIDRIAWGPQGANPQEYAQERRDQDPELFARLLGLVNEARLTADRVTPNSDRLLVILYRDDGLQYHLLQGGDRLTGVSEGDQSYRGSLDSPQLAALLSQLARRVSLRLPRAA